MCCRWGLRGVCCRRGVCASGVLVWSAWSSPPLNPCVPDGGRSKVWPHQDGALSKLALLVACLGVGAPSQQQLQQLLDVDGTIIRSGGEVDRRHPDAKAAAVGVSAELE
eukprot:scaffold130861_cov63-Phaeocystis_antarctica.AAC.2